jgi:hypothetical protein
MWVDVLETQITPVIEDGEAASGMLSKTIGFSRFQLYAFELAPWRTCYIAFNGIAVAESLSRFRRW